MWGGKMWGGKVRGGKVGGGEGGVRSRGLGRDGSRCAPHLRCFNILYVSAYIPHFMVV